MEYSSIEQNESQIAEKMIYLNSYFYWETDNEICAILEELLQDTHILLNILEKSLR